MLPFISVDESKLGPFRAYGLMVAAAFFAWDWAIMRFAVKRGYDRADFRVCTVFLGVFGWLFAWGVDVLFYRTEGFEGMSPLQGFSVTGAMVGATIGGITWAYYDVRGFKMKKRENPHALLPLAEVILATWPLAFTLGRVGCVFIHDHVGAAAVPGTLGSVFAVGFPRSGHDGNWHVLGPLAVVTGGSELRYDLGLLEQFVLVPLTACFAWMWKRPVPIGNYTIISCFVYGPSRFVLDFLRAYDGPTGEARHGGLTFAQYFSIAVVALGIGIIVWRRRATAIEPAKATS